MSRLWLLLFCNQFHYKMWALSGNDKEPHLLLLEERNHSAPKAICNGDSGQPLRWSALICPTFLLKNYYKFICIDVLSAYISVHYMSAR